MKEKRVTTWSELYDALYEDTFNPRLQRFKSRFAYRGVSSQAHDMKTSLMRLGGDYRSVEYHLLRQFKKYGVHHLPYHEDHDWYWLSVAQHYGLPTRLLDWTYSPEVALHFATANVRSFDKDGAVWKVNYKKAHVALPPSLKGVAEEEGTSILTVELLRRAFPSLLEFDKAASIRSDFVVFFEPPSIDARIFNQFAYFSILSKSTLLLDDWLKSRDEMYEKIVFPAKLKWEIRDKLDQNNVSERILFPGLGGIASWLARYYLPTGSALN